MTLFWFLLAGLFLLALLWFCIEQHLLLVRRQTISLRRLPPEWDGLRILQITDIHRRELGRDHRRIVRSAVRQKPDCIVLTGDIISRDMTEYGAVFTLLGQLCALCPVYFCMGNHELDLPPERWEPLRRGMAQAGCRILRNETAVLGDGKKPPLYLAGADLSGGVYRDEERGFRHLKDYTPAQLTGALGQPAGCTILLAHNPLLLDTYAAWGADLVLCGHVHGGLIRLPLAGGLLSPERKFFPKYDKGLYEKAGTKMYVSGGIGKPRFWNPPEINLLYLKSVQK